MDRLKKEMSVIPLYFFYFYLFFLFFSFLFFFHPFSLFSFLPIFSSPLILFFHRRPAKRSLPSYPLLPPPASTALCSRRRLLPYLAQPAPPTTAQLPAVPVPTAARALAAARAPAAIVTCATAMTSCHRLGESAGGRGGRAREAAGAKLAGGRGATAGAGWSHVLWLDTPKLLQSLCFTGLHQL
jgi:hypothetical protein